MPYEPAGNGAYITGFRNVTEPCEDFRRSYGIEMAVVTALGRLRRLLPGSVRDHFWMDAFGEVLPAPENGVKLGCWMRPTRAGATKRPVVTGMKVFISSVAHLLKGGAR